MAMLAGMVPSPNDINIIYRLSGPQYKSFLYSSNRMIVWVKLDRNVASMASKILSVLSEVILHKAGRRKLYTR